MKKIIFAACFMIAAFGATAQSKNVKVSIGAEFSGVTGNLNTLYSIAAGATAQIDFKIDKDAAITLNTGIIEFIGKKVPGTSLKYRSVAAVPVLGGVKYYFVPKVYGSAQLGGTFFTSSGGGSAFTYVPGVGFQIDPNLDILLKYTGYSDRGGAFGIRLGYTF